MPKYSASLDGLFHALADGTRRAVVEQLTRGPTSVSQLAEPFDLALPSVVAHLGVLERAEIVSSHKLGRVRTYQLVPDALIPANTWIVRQRLPQEKQLDRLGDYLNNRHATDPTSEQGDST